MICTDPGFLGVIPFLIIVSFNNYFCLLFLLTNKDFRGGLYPKGITEIAGESSAGKSQLCMQLLLQAQLPVHMGGLDGACVYLCTEGIIFDNIIIIILINECLGNVPLNRFKKFAEYYRKEKYTTVVKDEESGKSTTSSLLKDFDFHENVFIEKVDTMDGIFHIFIIIIIIFINTTLFICNFL